MIENWRDVPEAPGYQVSDLGNVRSVDRVVRRRWLGQIVSVRRQGRPIKTKVQKTGYVGVELAGRDHLVHRLVASAWIGPCSVGHQVAHADGVRCHNDLLNLRYATPAENAADRDGHGTTIKGERVFGAKLTAEKVAEIRASKGTASQSAIAADYGVTKQTIGHIHRGHTWGVGEERR